MAMVASELSGVPWSFTAHRGDIVQNNLLALKVENASFVRYISQSGAQMAAALGAPNASGKTAVIHMGVRLPGRTRGYDEAPRTPTILCPAKLTPVKGHRYLLEAMAILRSAASPTASRLPAAESWMNPCAAWRGDYAWMIPSGSRAICSTKKSWTDMAGMRWISLFSPASTWETASMKASPCA